MKKRIITGIAVAVAVVALTGIAAFFLFRDTWSAPHVVGSLEPLPGVTDACNASWSPDGAAILYATSPREGCVQKVYKVDSHGESRVCLAEGRLPVWSPDGARIAFATDNGVEIMNADGGGRLVLVDLARITLAEPQSRLDIDRLTWSPDGTVIALEVICSQQGDSGNPGPDCYDSDGIWLVNADGSSLRRLTTGSVYDSGVVWSPDGQKIAFVSYENDGMTGVWTSCVDGSDQRQLTSTDGYVSSLSWSPDGSRLAFAGWSPGEGDPGIWVIGADGADRMRLMEGSVRDSHPVWGLDGLTLAFECGGDIWIINTDGSGKTRLTNTSTSRASTWFTCSHESIDFREPRWSPDGTKLLLLNSLLRETDESWGVVRGDGQSYDRLWVMELDLEKRG